MSDSEFRLDQLADEFEAAWKLGLQPKLENYLDKIDSNLKSPLLELLIPLDIVDD